MTLVNTTFKYRTIRHNWHDNHSLPNKYMCLMKSINFYIPHPNFLLSIYWHLWVNKHSTVLSLMTLMMTMMTLIITMYHRLFVDFTVLITCSNWTHPSWPLTRGERSGTWFILTVGRTKDAIKQSQSMLLLHPVIIFASL